MSPSIRQTVTGGRSWPERYTYVPALRVGNFLFISGTTGSDEQNQIVDRNDIAAQTRTIFRKFERILNEVGATCADIVETTDYITTTENYGATAGIRREIFKGQFPTSTGVVVAGLLREGALIEISAVAVIPEKAR
jgi:enamine deaminase RidA (YjgF/YER057c/UK114 family)